MIEERDDERERKEFGLGDTRNGWPTYSGTDTKAWRKKAGSRPNVATKTGR
jgi:hypothetical protein